MIKKSFLWFLFFLVFFYFLFQAFFRMLAKNQEDIDIQQTRIIQENVKDRFTLFLKLPLNIGLIGADYFASGNLLSKDYGPFAKELLKINKEILGLSVLDHEGRIVRVFPPATNPNALGKISQNYPYLKAASAKEEKFWLSPPFKLFQGRDGFAFYIPIINGHEKKGWFTPLICTEIFLERFRHAKFFESYELIIKDKETNLSYFSTALVPETHIKMHQSAHTIYGRELIFESWRKDKDAIYQFPKYWSILGSLLLSTLLYLIFQFYQQRLKAREQLQEISVLLRFTSKEAITNLIDVQTELSALRPKEDITYLSNLIEQIDLLQTMAHTGQELHDENLDILPLVQDSLDNLSDITQKKSLIINLKQDGLKDVKVSINGWLIQNSVLSSIISHSIIYAEQGSTIEISHSQTHEKHFIVFHTHKIQSDSGKKALSMDRRLEVAKKVLHVHGGELFVQNDLAEGMLIRITLPL